MSRRKRHPVRLRPKVRSRRRSNARYGFLGLFFAASLAALAVARPWRALGVPSLQSLPGSDLIRVGEIRIEGAPEAFAETVKGGIDWTPGEHWGPRRPAREARRLLAEHPGLKTVRVRRSWREKSVTFELGLREPVATLSGEPEGRLLGAGGAVFPAFEGTFDAAGLPEVSLEGLEEDADLEPLARLIGAGREPGALPSPLMAVRYVSPESGWEGFLADGTFLEWGRLEWTGSKLSRLRQVLADAAPRLEGTLTADLKHFEDGKILIRPR